MTIFSRKSRTVQETQTDHREKIERQLLEAEQRFRDFFDYSLALFCTHDLSGNLLSVNRAAAEALGYAPDELIGRNLLELLPLETQKFALAYFKQIQDKDQSKGIMPIIAKNGDMRIWSFNNVLRTDAEGRDYILGCAQDITELKRKEEELTKSRQQFQSFMNNSPAVIFLKDEDGRLVFINESFETLFQVRSEDLLGKTDDFFAPEEVVAEIRRNDRIVMETEQPLKTVEFVPTPDGEAKYWLSHKFLFKDEAGKKFVGGIALDITERKQMEDNLKAAHDAALESARLKSAFLTNVSHEIRTPMNGVIGMTELLLDTPLDRVQREYAETIRQSGDALLTVINDILDLAKIESGKLRFESVDFDVREVVESTVEMLAERAFRKNIEIASLVALEIPQVLLGDPGRLRQVLTNLIGNAVKFTESGEIGVWVDVEKETGNNLYLRFTIIDSGIGISREDQKNLFQPFIQADNSTTRQYGGTGLGLAISKQIVEMMNGKITVESEPGKGSKFSFTACFTKKIKPDETVKIREFNLSDLLKGKKILIADSSPIIRRALKQYCSVWEMRPVGASSGEEALRLLNSANEAGKTFDIAVIDMNLPDWEGFSLAQKIKLDESLSETNVILTTVYGQRGDGAAAQEIGVGAYLTKPVRGSQLFDCLTTILREKQASLKMKEESVSPLITRHSLREAKAHANAASALSFDNETFSVLVVEDNEINRLLVLKQLEQLGIRPDVALDGVEALDKIAAKNYRLVLMDCQMPRLDGYETTRRIRQMEKEKTELEESFSPMVIIALTAHTLAGEREKCLTAGMNDYLSKPVKVKDLAVMLQYWKNSDENLAGLFVARETEKVNDNQSRKADPSSGLKPANLPLVESADPDFAAEIYTLYLTETEDRLEQITDALIKKDTAKIAQLAHAVRGNSLAVGVRTIAYLSEKIEDLGRQNKIEEISVYLEKLAEEFSQIQTKSFETVIRF